MGEVWLARHRLLARGAAIKLIRSDAFSSGRPDDAAATLRRFEREARATASLTSPHTVRVFDFGVTDEGRFYYVMELLDGCDLETLVRTFGPLPTARALYLVRQVCRSLSEAHGMGSRNDIEHLMQHVHVAPTPPSHSAEQPIPKSVDDLVLACLQKDPARRPTSVDEVLRCAMTGTADDVWDEEAARKWWEMHLPGACGWSERTRETMVETHTASAWLIPSWRN